MLNGLRRVETDRTTTSVESVNENKKIHTYPIPYAPYSRPSDTKVNFFLQKEGTLTTTLKETTNNGLAKTETKGSKTLYLHHLNMIYITESPRKNLRKRESTKHMKI